MNLTALLLSTALLFVCVPLLAQHPAGSCGFDAIHSKMLKTNPKYKNAVIQYEAQAREFARAQASGARISGGTYIMPIVFHIVHTGDTLGSVYNLTDQQIKDVVDYLNRVYNGTDPGQNGESVSNIGIQFELAKRDPNCNPTNGINHINGSSLPGYVQHGVNINNTNGTPDLTLKNFIRWDPTKYTNVWIVNKFDDNDGEFGGGTGGYAYFPFDPQIDGVVIRARDVWAGNTTLAHEMGHVFTLYHPFEGSNGTVCPPNANPSTDGDMVSDTDPVTNANFANPERTGTTNPCTGTNYTIATEHNIMNYVLNPTLFTAGQKTRLLAGANNMYRLGQINSSGDLDPSVSPTCTPKINFEWTEFQAREQAAASSTVGGCTRSYKDYSFNMLIGNNPSVATTATITLGGTAQEGVDYDITTNGSFTSASKVVSFPTGSHATKTFTIRIYDDAIVEGSETIILGMTVNNGGGNAVAGDGRPVETITIYDNDAAPYAASDVSKELNGTFNFSDSYPFTATASQFKTQIVYKASELLAAGLQAGSITALSFNVTKHSNAAFVYKNFTIKIAQTPQSFIFDYVNHTGAPVSDASMTTVYSSNYTTVNGVNTFTFSSPVTWNGTSNIAVSICYDNTGVTDASNDEVNFYSDDYSGTNASFIFEYINCGTAFGSPTYYNNNYKPVISFIRHDPGTQVQSVVNSSRSEYLGPNADVYFYDQSNGSLLARVKNLSSFNYGCTQVVIDRAGTGATAFRDNTPAHYVMNKTFRVLPTTNNTSGQYEITLYYTQQEVDGWQTATSGQSFNSIELVKVPGQISSATPANPNGAGTPVAVLPTRGMLGTNHSLTATFNTGFSGFGAGMVSSTLPVTLLDFSGRLAEGNALLTWQTTQEINNAYFMVERSTDGQHFTTIATLQGQGNSNTAHNYQYTDKQPAAAGKLVYYRLKQVDLDNNFTYSKIISLSADNAIQFTVTPTPATNLLYLHATGNIIAERISLYSTGGQLVKQWQQHNTSNPLDISAVSKGIYLLEIKTPTGVYHNKVVKQ